MKKKLQILSLIKNPSFSNLWNMNLEILNKYFEINAKSDDITNLYKYYRSSLDLIFLDKKSLKQFKMVDSSKFKEKNPDLKCIVIKNKPDKMDVKIFKNLFDDIIYVDHGLEWFKWKTISLLRSSYWSTHSKPSTIIYKTIIVDFANNFISQNGKEIKLTPTEFKIIKFLIESKGEWKTKQEIFQNTWQNVEKDTTRMLDQIIFKLKNKIDPSYFHIKRSLGIKFE